MSRRSATTTKVFVGSLPANATTEDLKRLFTPYGEIAECDIANRCGFLHLEDKDLAEKAIEELNNSTFMGVRISVEKGRVKPPNRSRGGARGAGAGGPMRGGKERAGPYSRDGFGPRPRGGGFGGRDYPAYPERYDYERGRYEAYGERRPPPGPYDDRRAAAYMGERGRPYSNGYDRRPPYDERALYPEAPRGYDDRRMPPAAGYDDRRPPMGERRALMDQPGSYDRAAASTDMFSRRDSAAKPMDRAAASYTSPAAAGYATAPPPYGQSGSGASGGYGGYGDTRGTAAMGYDTRAPAGGGGYGDARTPSYSESRGPPPLPGAGAAAAGAAAYAGSSAAAGYDAYGSRTGAYDSAYPPLPPQRGYSSGGGPVSRDLPSGPGRRF